MANMFFESWSALARVFIMGTLSYITLIVLLRASGKRTLSKMNMFDFVITVALGSAFSTIVISKDITLSEGIAALGLLIYLQYLVAWLSVRVKAFQDIVKADPMLVYYEGEYQRKAMRRERITERRFAPVCANRVLLPCSR